ncbi:hypothetical protein E0Z10_g6024 [Xylaria hypoxylon]|uniref:Uncharacterized protein n=1 Tax=Xylaria hypoxylon TaxID=37992 RepID=A0A4Z0Z2A9_9PEZI|nr:hypothetical protein E0Z10_g6024 [Xylaria hypoxylon]
MDILSYETFYMPPFERKSVKHSQRPKCEAFIVKSTIEPHTKAKVWWTKEGHRKLEVLYNNLAVFDDNNYHRGFVNGRPMIHPSVPVSTCAGSKRPPILYRVVCEQQPCYGMKAHGHGLLNVTPLNFQSLVDKHLSWRCRDPSTSSRQQTLGRKVWQLIKALQKSGISGLQIVIFSSSGPGWDHKAQRLFHVPLLGVYFGDPDYQTLPYMQAEYLLQSHIPRESILKIIPVGGIFIMSRDRRSARERE